MTTRTRQAKLNALIKEAKSDNLKIVARGGWHIIVCDGRNHRHWDVQLGNTPSGRCWCTK